MQWVQALGDTEAGGQVGKALLAFFDLMETGKALQC